MPFEGPLHANGVGGLSEADFFLAVLGSVAYCLFAQVVAALMERGLILKKGTIVDSTIISAPSSTKNKEKKRDPDAHQVKKGNTWHFGYKAHIGVDKDSGLVHTVKATAANVHDVSETSKLLTGEEEAVYGDSGYLGAGRRCCRQEQVGSQNQV